ncbi:MAG: hypothetical protein H6745_10530 [Deltaproteobacteria bacterium]|nr:hypothetical protein [Deltaproteobacteria bacterium]
MTFAVAILGLSAVAVAFMLISQSILSGRVEEGVRCAEMAKAALSATPVTDAGVVEASQCVEKVGSVDDDFNTAFRHMEEGFARVLSAVRDGRYPETKAGEGDVAAGLRELVLWLEHNDDDYMLAANSAAIGRCGELGMAATAGPKPDTAKAMAGLDCLNVTGSVHGDLEPIASQLRNGLTALRDAGQGDATDAAMVQSGTKDVSEAMAALATWREAHLAQLAETKAARDKLTY